ncbi:GNAT family N-acetyltransferase [Streptomyces abikoensis]|uniref:GNAT family N-acetyltransferase n=1 Tax=Streptomyces abikoensis TaxID=97398 RepID=UPI001671C41C|nr:GNAT family N-acetyltransferase [Streptomyces abikoensis]
MSGKSGRTSCGKNGGTEMNRRNHLRSLDVTRISGADPNGDHKGNVEGEGSDGVLPHRRLGWLKSLTLSSDLLILGNAADVTVTEEWISICTRSLPQLRIGNAIVSPKPPTLEDVPAWIRNLEQEVGQSAARYGRIVWEGGPAEEDVYRAFKDASFEPYDSLSMKADSLKVRPGATGVPMQAVQSDAEWRELLDFQIRANQVTRSSDRDFLAARLDLYRTESKAGNGAWFTAHADGCVVGCCGIALGNGLARLQGLEVATSHRGNGVGISLVSVASEWALRHGGTRHLVSVVDPDYHARRLFESVGFRPHDLVCGVVPVDSLTSPAVSRRPEPQLPGEEE